MLRIEAPATAALLNNISIVLFVICILVTLGLNGYHTIKSLNWINHTFSEDTNRIIKIVRRKTYYLLFILISLLVVFGLVALQIPYPLTNRPPSVYLIAELGTILSQGATVLLSLLIIERNVKQIVHCGSITLLSEVSTGDRELRGVMATQLTKTTTKENVTVTVSSTCSTIGVPQQPPINQMLPNWSTSLATTSTLPTSQE
jgi:hypothetical protein